jgi:hypothetical protein
MWPFKRKARPEPDELWSVGQSEIDGEAFFLRWKNAPVSKGRLSHRMGIAIPFDGVIEKKYPDTETGNYLALVEDALVAVLEPIPAEFVVALTLPNVRELMFYTSDPKAAQRALAGIQAQFSRTTFQSYTKPDPDWFGYEQCLPEATN